MSAILAALMLTSTLVSCNGDPADPTETTEVSDSIPGTETVNAETLRADAKDNLPADFSMNGKTVVISAQAGNIRQIDVDGYGEEIGDVVYDAVYKRTRSVAERLKADIQVGEMKIGYKDYGAFLGQNVLAGDDFAQIVSATSNASIGCGLNYIFHNLQDNKYLDFDQPWWWTEAMMEVTLDNKNVKYLIGDIQLSSYYFSGAMFFNKKLAADNGISEEEIYQTVLDRKWTYDTLREMAIKMYRDVDGDGAVSEADTLGMYLDTFEYVKFMEYGTDVRRYRRDENGYPVMDYDLERADRTFVKLNELLNETKGILYMKVYSRKYDRFVEGRSGFYGGLLGDAMSASIRVMEEPYGILPYPMLDEEQSEYETIIHPSGAFYAIPITCKNADEMGAVLEAMCSESYRSVIEPFFETALKAKYSHDSQSGQCIDIIRKVAVKNFLVDYTNLGGGGFLIGYSINSGVNNVASDHAVHQPKTNQKIQDMIRDYQSRETAD